MGAGRDVRVLGAGWPSLASSFQTCWEKAVTLQYGVQVGRGLCARFGHPLGVGDVGKRCGALEEVALGSMWR